MSDPAEPRSAEPPRYRYPGELTEEQAAEMRRSRVVDAERYIDWLENGEGPDPWDESSG
jgi:hypothetical protein